MPAWRVIPVSTSERSDAKPYRSCVLPITTHSRRWTCGSLQQRAQTVTRRVPPVSAHRPVAVCFASPGATAVAHVVTAVPIARTITGLRASHQDELVTGE